MDDNNPPPHRTRRERPPTTPDPIEIAMEAEAAGVAPTGQASLLLADQRRLIGWQIASERAGFALKVLTGLAGLAAAAALGVMVWQAAHADGVVLEPFTVPPALAADGVSGQVVASQVLDELARLRTETVTPGQARHYADDWGRSIKVSIPGSGISLGDLQAALRQWLGRETHITGEVYRTNAGLAVTARVPGRPGLTSEGPADQLPALARSLGRQVYRETQPLLYARWAGGHGGQADALAIVQPIALTGASGADRAEAFDIWANLRNSAADPAGAVAMARRGLAYAPDSSVLWRLIATNEGNQGHWEAALAAWREVARRAPRDARVSPGYRAPDVEQASIAALLYDWPEVLKSTAAAARTPERARDEAVQIDRVIVTAHARLHDMAAARARLAAPEFALPWQAQRNRVQMLQAGILAAWIAEDWPEGVRLGTAFLAEPAVYSDTRHSAFRAQVGLARAMTGDAAGAHALLDDLAEDCLGCVTIKAQALAAWGQRAEADRLAAIAQAQAPSVPAGPYWRARLRLDARDAPGALALFYEAQRRQPKWADPFEGEGEALAALGRWAEAETAYAKAEPLAPKWGRGRLKRGQALAKLGKAAEAHAQWRTAAGLYLTPAERAELLQVNR